jgi:hypothetical protein
MSYNIDTIEEKNSFMKKRIRKTGKKSNKGKPTKRKQKQKQKQKQKKETHSQNACECKEPKRLYEYETYLQGPPQNKFGGHRTRKIKGLRGNTFGPASPCYVYTKEEREALERDLREKGKLEPQQPGGRA